MFCVAQARAWVTKEIKREKKTTDSNFTILLPITSLVSCLSCQFEPRRRSPSHQFVCSFSSPSPPLPTHLLTSTFTLLLHFLFFNQNPHTCSLSHYTLKPKNTGRENMKILFFHKVCRKMCVRGRKSNESHQKKKVW